MSKFRNLNLKIDKQDLLFFLIVLAFGFMCFYQLDMFSLDEHEIISFFLAKSKINFNFFSEIANDRSPPLYQLILHCWIKLFGSSIFAFRSLSALFAVASVYCCTFIYNTESQNYKFKRNLLALLIGFNFYTLDFAQYTRSSSLFLLLSILLIGFYRNNKLVSLFLTTTLILYTHYFAIPFLMSMFLALLYFRKIDVYFKKKFIALMFGTLFFMPWFFIFVSGRVFSNEVFWISRPSLLSILNILGYYFNSYLFLAVFIAFLIAATFKKRQVVSKENLLIIITFVFLAFVKSTFSTSVFEARYFVPLIVLFMLIFVDCLLVFNIPSIYVGVLTLLLAVNNSDNFLFRRPRQIKNANFEAASKFVIKKSEEMPVVAIGFFYKIFDFYSSNRNSNIQYINFEKLDYQALNFRKDIRKAYVFYKKPETEKLFNFLSTLEGPKKITKYHGIDDIYLFDFNP